jgi:hypothetical protein
VRGLEWCAVDGVFGSCDVRLVCLQLLSGDFPLFWRYEANADVNLFLFRFLGSEVGAVSEGDGRL